MLTADPVREPAVAIADDLTGATEVALVLAEAGLGEMTRLWRGGALPPVGRTSAVNLDTRDLSAAVARARLAEFLDGNPEARRRIVFKKVDSTARRHLAAEIDVCLDYPEFEAVVVALAAPDDDRRTTDGIHYVGERPIDRTPFARDLARPTAHLPSLLTADTGRTCRGVPLEAVRAGVEATAAAILAGMAAGHRVVAMDCESREDLRIIARAARAVPRRVLPVGSAAMFRELVGAALSDTPWTTAPILVVCGSLHPISRRQIARLRAATGAREIGLAEGNPRATVRALEAEIEAGRVAVLSTAAEPAPEGDDGETGIRIAGRIGALVRTVVEATPPAGLVAMGGGIAVSVIRALGADDLRIRDRLSPVVPVLELVGGCRPGLPLITKGGGVGGEDILVDAVTRLRRVAGARPAPDSVPVQEITP